MPAVSRNQQIAAAIARHDPSKLYDRNRGLLKMKTSDLEHYASTPRKGLPKHKKQSKKLGMKEMQR